MKRYLVPFIFIVLFSAAGYTLELTLPDVWGPGQWRDGVYMSGVTDTAWKAGKRAIALDDGAYRPAPDTELLINFDDPYFRDEAGRFALVASTAEFTEQISAFGRGCGLFQYMGEGILLKALPNSIFYPGAAAGGDLRSFTIEFWLNPAALRQGETIFEWNGGIRQNNKFFSQKIRAYIDNQRLYWRFENIFFSSASEPIDITLGGREILIPKKWTHNLIRFDEGTGLLEYAKQNIPESITYATASRRQGPGVYTPKLGAISEGEIVLGRGYTGFLDEFRFSRAFITTPQLTKYTSNPGVYISKPVDLGASRSPVFSITSLQETPGQTAVEYFYHISDSYTVMQGMEGAWKPFTPGRIPASTIKGRFLQIMMFLYPDGGMNKSPLVASLSIDYERSDPPSPPTGVLAEARDGAVALSWKASPETEVKGYRVYYGVQPGGYFGMDSILGPSPIDIPSPSPDSENRINLTIPGLKNGQIYYFAVTAYTYPEFSHQSAFSRETSARPRKTGPQS